MNKILIIDDKSEATGSSQNLAVLVSELINSNSEISKLIDISRVASNYFEWDPAGNYCIPKFKSSEYDYIFIHHSQQDDKMLPSNLIDLIKQGLGDKIVLFSGSITENFEDDLQKGNYRSIKRDVLWNKLIPFIKKSFLLQKWELEILFYDFENILISKIILLQDMRNNNSQLFASDVMIDFLKLKRVVKDSALHTELMKLNDFELIDKLRSL